MDDARIFHLYLTRASIPGLPRARLSLQEHVCIDVVDVFIGHNHRVRSDPQGRASEERPEQSCPNCCSPRGPLSPCVRQKRKQNRSLSSSLSLSLSLSLLSRSLLCKQTINLLRFLLFALGGKLSYVVVAAVSLLLHADRPRVSSAAQRRGGCRGREGEEASFVFAGIRYHKGNWSRPSLRPGCVCLDDFMCST